MGYIRDIFERANLQHIREYLLNGSTPLKVNDNSYEQRLEGSTDKVLELLKTNTTINPEDLENLLMQTISVHDEVYMEIGLQAGMRLATQLFNSAK